ncbi:MAG: hypothetical protein MI867_27545, partial [Pseudomonadales bacterium]|nr:hypothetical protein [Pseudomonadales bacterium]
MEKPIRMAGPPRRIFSLDVLTSLPRSYRLVSKSAFGNYCEKQELPCRLKPVKNSKTANLKLKLAEDTAPGEYQAELVTEKQSYPVQIKVQPTAKLMIYPKRLVFFGERGKEISGEIALSNRGNVAIEVPKTAIANLYCLQDIPAAITDTFRQGDIEPEQMVHHLVGQLKHGYGGMMKCRLESEEQHLGVQEQQVFHFRARVPKEANAGRVYAGIMHIGQFH